MKNQITLNALEDSFNHGRVLATIKVPYLGIKIQRLKRMPFSARYIGWDHLYPFIVRINYGGRKDKTEPLHFVYQGFNHIPYIHEVIRELYTYAQQRTFMQLLKCFTDEDNANKDTCFRVICYMTKMYQQLHSHNIYYDMLMNGLVKVYDSPARYSFHADNERPGFFPTTSKSTTYHIFTPYEEVPADRPQIEPAILEMIRREGL